MRETNKSRNKIERGATQGNDSDQQYLRERLIE